MPNRDLILKLLRFGVVGGVVTLSFMGMNWAFAHWGRLGPDAAYLCAYPLAVGLHYALNKWWTFGHHAAVGRRQNSEYVIMMVTVFVLQTAIFKGLTGFFGVPGWLASGLATVLQVALSFLWMQRRIFVSAPR